MYTLPNLELINCLILEGGYQIIQGPGYRVKWHWTKFFFILWYLYAIGNNSSNSFLMISNFFAKCVTLMHTPVFPDLHRKQLSQPQFPAQGSGLTSKLWIVLSDRSMFFIDPYPIRRLSFSGRRLLNSPLGVKGPNITDFTGLSPPSINFGPLILGVLPLSQFPLVPWLDWSR